MDLLAGANGLTDSLALGVACAISLARMGTSGSRNKNLGRSWQMPWSAVALPTLDIVSRCGIPS